MVSTLPPNADPAHQFIPTQHLQKLHQQIRTLPPQLSTLCIPTKELAIDVFELQQVKPNTPGAYNRASKLGVLAKYGLNVPVHNKTRQKKALLWLDKIQASDINLLVMHRLNNHHENDALLSQSLIRRHSPFFHALLRQTDQPDVAPLFEIAAVQNNQDAFGKLLYTTQKTGATIPNKTLDWVAANGQTPQLNKLLAYQKLPKKETKSLRQLAQTQQQKIQNLQKVSPPGKAKLLLQCCEEVPSPENRLKAIRLIQAGAPVNQTYHDGKTSLICATENGNSELAQLLIKAGAKLNQADKGGLTPLSWAALCGHNEIAQALINAGADVNQADKGGDTPLAWAASNGQKEVIQTLLQAGANVNHASRNGSTPLSWATVMGHTEIAEKLIQAGADINKANTDGDTPLSLAIRYKRHELAQLLRDHDATEE